jgi:hypothetical protein
MPSPIDWDAVGEFLEAIGRIDSPIVLAIFPPKQGPCIHIRCSPLEIPTADVERILAARPHHSLGMVINPAMPQPSDWGDHDDHYTRRKDKTRGRLKAYGAQDAHIDHAIAIWAECDGTLSLEAQAALPLMAGLPEPSLSVWTGGKSLHHYWIISPSQQLPLPVFRELQKRLAYAFLQVDPESKPDESLSNPNRLMRLPGGLHPATRQRARIHHNSGETFTIDELDLALPDLPATHASGYQPDAQPGDGLRARWFHSLPPTTQRELATELLSLLPPRQAPGTGTYPAAFSTLAALVHHFGPDTAVEICTAAGWCNEHWDPAAKVLDIGPARLRASMGKLVARAEDEAGWRRPPHLPPYPYPDDDDGSVIDGFDEHEPTTAAPIPEPEPPVYTRHHCRQRLEQAVEDDISPADLELLIHEISSKSDLSPFTLRSLHAAIRQQAEQMQLIEAEAEAIATGTAPAPQDQFSLQQLLPPLTAFSLQNITQHLPYSDSSVAMAFLASISGLTKLGTSVCGNPLTQYIVPTNLYVCTVAATGQKKTPLQKLVVDIPTKGIRRDLAKENSRAIDNWREQCQGMKKDERPPQPTPIYLHIQDYTGEALAAQLQALEARAHAVLILRDELAGLFGSMNQYRAGRGADEQQLLELFDGTPHASLRISAGDRSYSRCHVSIYGGIQPEVLRALIKDGDPTGKWARFIFSPLPQRTLPLPTTITPEQQADIDTANEMLETIARAVYAMPPRLYHLDREAVVAFSLYEHTKQQQALKARLRPQQAIKGKAAGKVLRVAGLLHVLTAAENSNTPAATISYATLQTAIEIVEAHDYWALTLHDTDAEGEASGAISQLMRRIHAISLKDGAALSWREISRRLKSTERQGVNVTVAEAAMKALAGRGFGELIEGPRGGLRYLATQELPVS